MNILEQGLLKYLTADQLTLIQSKHIGIGGAGGLGSNVAMMLVRTGFRHIEIIDKDVVDPSNLNRQQFHAGEIDLPKVSTLKKRLLKINPDLEMFTHECEWNESIADNYFQESDYIIEAFDVVDWKYRFVNYYQDKVSYVISGVGMAGLIEKRPMRVRRVGNLFICGDTSTDSAKGHPPMAPRVTMCAAMMAEVILDLTLGITN